MAKTAAEDDCQIRLFLQKGSSLPSWLGLAAHLGGGNRVAQLPMLPQMAVGTQGHQVIK
jgi:hypothetical protein